MYNLRNSCRISYGSKIAVGKDSVDIGKIIEAQVI